MQISVSAIIIWRLRCGSHHRNEHQMPRKQGIMNDSTAGNKLTVRKGISRMSVKQNKKFGPAGENVCARQNPKGVTRGY